MTPDRSTADLANAAADAHRDEQPDLNVPANDATDAPVMLFAEQQMAELRSRWDQIQAGFVDEPHGAVEKADVLVADTISRLAEGFARTRAELDHQWKHGGSVSTEELRQALRHYRSFFSRLLEA